MSAEAAAPRGRGLPIALQVGILLIVSLVAAQAVSLLLVLISPPPPFHVYQVAEIARALKGGDLETRNGGKLARTVEKAPPPDAQPRGRFNAQTQHTLAATLQLPDDKVRFGWILRPNRLHLFERSLSPRGPAPGNDFLALGPPGPRWMGPRDGRRGPPGPGGPMFGPRPPHRSFTPTDTVFGDFVAAVQGPDGRWTVVRTPQPMLNPWQQRMTLWLIGCLLVVLPGAYLFARRITAPIHRFAGAAQALGRDPQAPPIALTGPAEIGAAAQAFNDMQARIRKYVDDRTGMVGAISHDLRTPLARIRYKLEKAPEDLKVQILSDVDKMEQMIGSVLAFIREESEPRRRERLDLLSVVECVADETAMTGADVEISAGWPIQVEGDALALQRMLTNLVDNAVKYGGRARLTVQEVGGEARVQVQDDGPGLAESELERVFTPFYRPTAARTLDDKGVGLGLAVARTIARAHGGDIELASREGCGVTATVRLPLVA